MKPAFYCLLHLAPEETALVNNQERDFAKRIRIYARNVLALANSLSLHGYSLTCVTNDRNTIEQLLVAKPTFEIIEIPFRMKVPKGITFYSNHFAFDLYEFIGQQNHEYAIVLDADVLMARKLDRKQIALMENRTSLAYDITQDSEKDSSDEIKNDLLQVLRKNSELRWYGGEFLGGTPDFFSDISLIARSLSASYESNIEKIFHHGMETLLTSSLVVMREQGKQIEDAGEQKLVSRVWNVPFLKQKKFLETEMKSVFIHLPGHKLWISSIADQFDKLQNPSISFFEQSRKEMKLRLWKRVIKFLRFFGKNH